MARIKVISECPFYDGMSVTFKAPCDCTAASGLKVYYEDTSQTFDFVDAHGKNLAGVGNLFAEGAYVKVILNTGESKAYIQNADTNAYLERRIASGDMSNGGTIDGDLVIGDGSLVENADGSLEERKLILYYGKSLLGFSNSTLEDLGGIEYEYGGGKIKGLDNAEEDDEAVPYGQMVEYVAANSGGCAVYEATPLEEAEVTDPDGNTYTGATEYETTIPDGEIFVGKQIIIVPTMMSATTQPFITVNGARSRIYTNAATTSAFFNGTRVDFIRPNYPLALMYMGVVDETTGMTGWKCLNSVRTNIEAIMSNGDAGVNKIPMTNGKNEKLVFRSHKDANLVGEAVYNSSSNRYDVTLPGIGNPNTGFNGVYTGLEVTIIPDVTNKVSAKLAVNNYDGTASGSQIYCSTGAGTAGYVSVPASFLKAGMPVKMKYTGSGWRITDTPYLDAEALKGAVAANHGGTGRSFLTSGYYLVGNGLGAVQLLNKSQVLSDIGAASASELDEVKTSVSEGKALIASAVTDKGVETADDATFAQIAENIALIQGGELAGDDEEIVVEDAYKTALIGVLDGTVTNLALPDEMTSIRSHAFYGCTKLVLTSLPSGVTSIGQYAFYNCTNLALTSLPSGVTSIGQYTFNRCTNLALTSLPSGVTSIGQYAFYYCTNLALASLPSSITSIGNYAFQYCTNLKSITFEGTPTGTIFSSAFSKCTNLTTINVPWAEGAVANAPWGATNATINYNYTGG